MICSREGCESPVRSRGLCTAHYCSDRRRGLWKATAVGPVAEHVARLRDLGWQYLDIAECAGTHRETVERIGRGQRATVLAETAAAILRVPLSRTARCRVDSVGTRRRVQGLTWMGWSHAEIAARAGVQHRSLEVAMYRRTLPAWMAERVERAYEELAYRVGPSVQAKVQARRLRVVPPMAWDDIDDPAAEPQGVRGAA